MDAPLVKINTATADEIARLYDVSSRRAERIVEYREENGYFRGPEDLTRVGDISLSLAHTLSPHIDWDIPAEPEQPKERDWTSAASYAVLIATLAWVLQVVARDLPLGLRAYRAGDPSAWVRIWTNASVVATECFAILALCLWSAESLTRARARARRFHRIAYVLIGFLLLSMVSGGLASAVYYQFYEGWHQLLGNQAALVAIPAVSCVGIIFTPVLLVLWRPTLMYSTHLARFCDAGHLILPPLLIWGGWINRYEWPLWITIVSGFAGLFMVHIGILTLRTGESFFQLYLSSLFPADAATHTPDTAGWKTWINTRLPDEEQQMALKRALDEKYPPSKARTFAAVIVLVGGGFLITNACSAIIELYVQDWWEQLFG